MMDSGSTNNQLAMISNTIFELERNIADLNSNYKSLLTKLNVNFLIQIDLCDLGRSFKFKKKNKNNCG
jgi:hypothetical protein